MEELTHQRRLFGLIIALTHALAGSSVVWNLEFTLRCDQRCGDRQSRTPNEPKNPKDAKDLTPQRQHIPARVQEVYSKRPETSQYCDDQRENHRIKTEQRLQSIMDLTLDALRRVCIHFAMTVLLDRVAT